MYVVRIVECYPTLVTYVGTHSVAESSTNNSTLNPFSRKLDSIPLTVANSGPTNLMSIVSTSDNGQTSIVKEQEFRIWPKLFKNESKNTRGRRAFGVRNFEISNFKLTSKWQKWGTRTRSQDLRGIFPNSYEIFLFPTGESRMIMINNENESS